MHNYDLLVIASGYVVACGLIIEKMVWANVFFKIVNTYQRRRIEAECHY